MRIKIYREVSRLGNSLRVGLRPMKNSQNCTDHANEQSRLLSSSSDTSVTNDTNSKPSSKTSETDAETGTQLKETGEKSHLSFHYEREFEKLSISYHHLLVLFEHR